MARTEGIGLIWRHNKTCNYMMLLLTLKQMGDRDQFSPQMVSCRIILQAIVSQTLSLNTSLVQTDCCIAVNLLVDIRGC